LRRRKLGIKADAFFAVKTWTRAEDAMLGTMFDRLVAERLGRSSKSVYKRRKKLGIKGIDAAWNNRAWTAAEDRLLGTVSDSHVAKRLGIGIMSVFRRLRRLGITASQPKQLVAKSVPAHGASLLDHTLGIKPVSDMSHAEYLKAVRLLRGGLNEKPKRHRK